MDNKDVMFCLLRNEIKAEALPDKIEYDVKALYELSKRHDLAHLIADALIKNAIVAADSPYYSRLQKEKLLAVYRVEQFNFELKRICDVFEKEKIPFIPLKGSVLREYYPETWMRTSCDIDILVHEDDLERATVLLTRELSYTCKGNGGHDIQFYSSNGIHLELHYSLIEEELYSKIDKPLESVWEYSLNKEKNSYRYSMTDEMFYYYHVAHMAKHFVNGGCGIRPFIDLWILNGRFNFDLEKKQQLFTNGGLTEFERYATELSGVWFDDKQSDDFLNRMQKYIVFGGVYGNTENRVAANQSKKGGKFGYIMSRIFMPYSILKFQYPILQKHKILFPFMEVARWFRIIFRTNGGIKQSVNEINTNNNISPEKVYETADMMQKLGL